MAWNEEQLANARVIAEVGQEMGMSARDINIAIMAAMVESNLINVPYGDRDSVGLFQQRAGWGSTAERMNPLYAAKKFFDSLKQVRNRNSMSMGNAAQAVQRSAYPDRYAARENDALRMSIVLGVNGTHLPYPLNTPQMDLSLTHSPAGMDSGLQASPGAVPDPAGVSGMAGDKTAFAGIGKATDTLYLPTDPNAAREQADLMPGGNHDFPAINNLVNGNGARQAMIQAAMNLMGTPYSYGGGHAAKAGVSQGRTGLGIDCSGLVRVALQAAGMDVGPMTAAQQMTLGQQVPDWHSLQPGDLVAAANGSHIGIYIGNGQMLVAPHTGSQVQIQAVHPGMVGIKLSIGGSANTGALGATAGAAAGASAPAQAVQPQSSTPAGMDPITTPYTVQPFVGI